jgi:ABC-type transport system, involved in lipoprotein release, permease component
MDTLWKIALRNVERNRKRTLITGIVLMVGIGLFIAYDSILAGMDRLAIDVMADYSSSFLKLRTNEYEANAAGTPLDYGIAEPELAMAKLKEAAPGISATTERTLFVAQASNYRDAEPVMAAAVSPATDAAVFAVAGDVKEGSWLSSSGSGSSGKEVVIGAALAKELGLKLGDGILLSARTVYDNENADEFRIVGLISGDVSLSATASVYLSYAAAREFLGESLPVTEIDSGGPRASSLDVELAASDRAAKAASAALPNLHAAPIGEFAKDYLALKDSKQKGSYMLIIAILLIAAVGIVNTILMSVYSRVREIGVLRAFGMTPKDIKALFVREGIIIGAIGSAAGLALGAIIVWYFSSAGLSIAGVFGDLDLGSIPAAGTLRGEWRPAAFVIGFCFGIVVSWLAARIPAKRAAALEPTDALRFV